MEDERAYRAACHDISLFFAEHPQELSGVCTVGRRIERSYTLLEPYFHDFTEGVCHCCATPCCVNRHGFPDFEDIVLFFAMGVRIPHFDFHVVDTDACQFLGAQGCTLPRRSRSYRCTWYFCDSVLDRFESSAGSAYEKFDAELERLGKQRTRLLSMFRSLWFDEVSNAHLKTTL